MLIVTCYSTMNILDLFLLTIVFWAHLINSFEYGIIVKKMSTVNRDSARDILYSFFGLLLLLIDGQSPLKDCHNKECHRLHAPNIYMCTRCGIQLPAVCAWPPFVVVFYPNIKAGRTCLRFHRFWALGWFLLYQEALGLN